MPALISLRSCERLVFRAPPNLRHGFALIEFTLTIDGRVTDIRAIESSHPIFAASAESIVSRYQCRGIGREVQVRVPFRQPVELGQIEWPSYMPNPSIERTSLRLATAAAHVER